MYHDCVEDPRLLKESVYRKKLNKILHELMRDTPSLREILDAKMTMAHKAEVVEWYFIYSNSMEMSEERRLLKKKIQTLVRNYQQSYQDYLKYREEIKRLEEANRDCNELHELQLQILHLETSSENKNVIYRKYLELREKVEDMDEEFYKMKHWLQSVLQLPHDRLMKFPDISDLTQVLQSIRTILDEELFGMNKVKEQILLFMHNKLRNPNMKGCCLGLVGPPGVGKTSIARCLSRILGYPFEQISFGGIHSVDYLRGFDYTYVGSRPGEIVRCLTRMKYKNGILFLDEYDKVSQQSEINSCLLHITDFSQNDQFRDNFLSDISIDLSSLWFIYSMNELPSDQALRDRVFFIPVEGYTEKEQVRILCDYLLPKHLQNLNLDRASISISDSVGHFIVQHCLQKQSERGVRTIEKGLKDLLSKLSFLITNQRSIPCTFLPPASYFPMTLPLSVDISLCAILLEGFTNHLSSHSSMAVINQMYL